MGLDMYFKAKRWLLTGILNNGQDEPTKQAVAQALGNLPEDWEVQEIVCEAGYWRKANAIHKWFVDNVQNGEDECREHRVSPEQMEKLLAVVNTVLEGETPAERAYLAQEHLPTQSGCFFGHLEYDEWYFRKLEHTKDILEKALDSPEGWEFYYQSSW